MTSKRFMFTLGVMNVFIGGRNETITRITLNGFTSYVVSR